MKKYIKINDKNEIVDVLFDYQKRKFDGTEIFYEDTEIKKHKINDKSISSEYGVYIFTWNGSSAVEKTQSEIDNDADFIVKYRKMEKRELIAYIKDKFFESTKSLEEIRIRWATFKTNASSFTTKQEIDDAVDNAKAWLES